MKPAPTAIAAALWLIAGGGARALAHQQTTSFGEIAYPAPGTDGANLTWRLRIRTLDLARLLGPRMWGRAEPARRAAGRGHRGRRDDAPLRAGRGDPPF